MFDQLRLEFEQPVLGAMVTSVSPAVAGGGRGQRTDVPGSSRPAELSRETLSQKILKRRGGRAGYWLQNCPGLVWNFVSSFPAFISRVVLLSLPAPDVCAHLETPWADVLSATLPDP